MSKSSEELEKDAAPTTKDHNQSRRLSVPQVVGGRWRLVHRSGAEETKWAVKKDKYTVIIVQLATQGSKKLKTRLGRIKSIVTDYQRQLAYRIVSDILWIRDEGERNLALWTLLELDVARPITIEGRNISLDPDAIELIVLAKKQAQLEYSQKQQNRRDLLKSSVSIIASNYLSPFDYFVRYLNIETAKEDDPDAPIRNFQKQIASTSQVQFMVLYARRVGFIPGAKDRLPDPRTADSEALNKGLFYDMGHRRNAWMRYSLWHVYWFEALSDLSRDLRKVWWNSTGGMDAMVRRLVDEFYARISADFDFILSLPETLIQTAEPTRPPEWIHKYRDILEELKQEDYKGAYQRLEDLNWRVRELVNRLAYLMKEAPSIGSPGKPLKWESDVANVAIELEHLKPAPAFWEFVQRQVEKKHSEPIDAAAPMHLQPLPPPKEALAAI